ncbi:MAG: winged helix DNA-binding protein [Nanoarchaeota archaeon]|nr:winged helix DNA-binding protein [Nanoarchaeota archaeon]
MVILEYLIGKMMAEKIFDIIFREKPALMLVNMKNAKDTTYASSLAKSVDCTYSHVVKILQKMQEADLVQFEKQGRLKLLRLTKKGREVAEHIEGAKNLL